MDSSRDYSLLWWSLVSPVVILWELPLKQHLGQSAELCEPQPNTLLLSFRQSQLPNPLLEPTSFIHYLGMVYRKISDGFTYSLA